MRRSPRKSPQPAPQQQQQPPPPPPAAPSARPAPPEAPSTGALPSQAPPQHANADEMDFAFKTPTTGPSVTPQFPNFSPLFSYSSPAPAVGAGIGSSLPPSASTDSLPFSVRRSPRLVAKKPVPTNSSSSVFSPSGFLTTTPNASGSCASSAMVDAQPLEMPPPIQPSMSALGRYQRHVQQHTHADEDVEQQMDELRAMAKENHLGRVGFRSGDQVAEMMSPHVPLAFGGGGGGGGGSGGQPSAPLTAMSEFELSKTHSVSGFQKVAKSKSFGQQRLRPVGPGGSSCHQCKNRREHAQLNFCCNKTRNKGEKRKICRKKYCDHCLKKFNYLQFPQRPGQPADRWECPACRGICVCAACKRKRCVKVVDRFQEPAFSFAQNIISDPQFLGGLAGNTRQ